MQSSDFYLCVDEIDGLLWKIPSASAIKIHSTGQLLMDAEKWGSFSDAWLDRLAFFSADALGITFRTSKPSIAFVTEHDNKVSFVYTRNVDVEGVGGARFVWPFSFGMHLLMFSGMGSSSGGILAGMPPIQKDTLVRAIRGGDVHQFNAIAQQNSPSPRIIRGASLVTPREFASLLRAEDRRFLVECCTSSSVYRNSLDSMKEYTDCIKSTRENHFIRKAFVDNMKRYQIACRESMRESMLKSKFSDDPMVREGPRLIAKREREWRERREQQKRTRGGMGGVLLPYCSGSDSYPVDAVDAVDAVGIEAVLPADVLHLVVAKVVDDALATADRAVARQAIANLACTNRQFSQITSLVLSKRIENAQRFLGAFVDTGSVEIGLCPRIDDFLEEGRSIQKLPFLSVCLFGCSLTTLMKSPSTLRGFFDACKQSNLSVDVCAARAAVGHDRRPASPCLNDETALSSSSECASDPQTQRKPRGVRRSPPTKIFKLLQIAALAR